MRHKIHDSSIQIQLKVSTFYLPQLASLTPLKIRFTTKKNREEKREIPTCWIAWHETFKFSNYPPTVGAHKSSKKWMILIPRIIVPKCAAKVPKLTKIPHKISKLSKTWAEPPNWETNNYLKQPQYPNYHKLNSRNQCQDLSRNSFSPQISLITN